MTWKKGQAPWETGQAGAALAGPGFAKGQAPWEQEGEDDTPSPRELLDMSEAVLDERHPAIDWKDRAKIKNFSNSPDVGVKYLQEKYPELSVGADSSGIKIQAPGDEYPRRLDPSKLELEDISDLGADVGAGVTSAIGTAGGAGLGLVTGGPGFMVPAAMVGSGAASAGTEALRQKIGQMLGLPQEIDKKQVLTQGAIGMAAPAVFGAAPMSSAVKGYAAKELGRPGQTLTADAVEGLIKAGERGYAGQLYDWSTRTAAPKVASMLSGASERGIKTYANRMNEIDSLNDTGVTDVIGGAQKKVSKGINDLVSNKGKQIQQLMEQSGQKVDIGQVRKIYQDHIEELMSLKNNHLDNEGVEQQLKTAMDEYQSVFNEPYLPTSQSTAGVPNEVSARGAFELQQQLKDKGDLYRMTGGPMPRHATSTSVPDKRLADKALDAYGATGDALETATGGVSATLKGEYKNLAELRKGLQPYFSSPERAFETLRNLDRPSKQLLYERLQKLADEGVDLMPDAELIEAYNYFGKPSLTPISSGGTTSTSRSLGGQNAMEGLGALAGRGMTGNYTGTVVGKQIGKTAGGIMFGPAAVKQGIKAGKVVEKYGRKLKTEGNKASAGAKSVWDMVRERDLKEEE